MSMISQILITFGSAIDREKHIFWMKVNYSDTSKCRATKLQSVHNGCLSTLHNYSSSFTFFMKQGEEIAHVEVLI